MCVHRCTFLYAKATFRTYFKLCLFYFIFIFSFLFFFSSSKIPGGSIEDSEVLDGVMLNKDIPHPKMRR